MWAQLIQLARRTELRLRSRIRLRLWVCLGAVALLFGAQSGCDVACTRVMTLAAQDAAETYLRQTRERRALVENAKLPPYVAAVVKFRGVYGSRKTRDWRLLSSRERQLALVGLLIGKRNAREDKLLAALIAGGGVDPFVADPYGLVPFALAFERDRIAAKLLVVQLRSHPRTRPTDAVLCGLRASRLAGTLSTLRAYCPCVSAG